MDIVCQPKKQGILLCRNLHLVKTMLVYYCEKQVNKCVKTVLCVRMGEVKVTVNIVESYLSESDLYGGRL